MNAYTIPVPQTLFALALGLLLLGAAGMVSAQTPTTTPTTPPPAATPGVPNTGAGGGAGANMLILGASALVSLAGAGYLIASKRRAALAETK